jgi:HSP20 family protein
MFSRFRDLDRTHAGMERFYHQVDRLLQEQREGPHRDPTDEAEGLGRDGWPWLRFFDAGTSLVLKTDLPGLTEKDVGLAVQQNVLTLTGERKLDAPEGYFVHRQERTPFKFARSFVLPCRIDAEKSTAVLKDGVMTITLPKAPDAQPRQINIKAQ